MMAQPRILFLQDEFKKRSIRHFHEPMSCISGNERQLTANFCLVDELAGMCSMFNLPLFKKNHVCVVLFRV
jgi:hypothetical protein